MRRNLKQLLLFSFTALLCASQGRDFAGTYRWADAVDLGDQVNLRLTVDIHNSGADAVSAVVEFRGQADDQERREFLAAVTCRHGEQLRLTGLLSISKREFALWREGRTPRLVIVYLDADGNRREQNLDIVRTPVSTSVQGDPQ